MIAEVHAAVLERVYHVKQVMRANHDAIPSASPLPLPADATPGSLYGRSARLYPNTVPIVECPASCEVRLLSDNGGIKWNRPWVNVTTMLAGEYVGFEESDKSE